MQQLQYRKAQLFFEHVHLDALAAAYGTPLYVYSETALRDNFRRIESAFSRHPHSICYALKANSNPELLRLLGGLGAGADVVSLGELRLALDAGILPEKIVFAGVGKRDDEIEAALQAGIAGLNVESEMELQAIGEIAARLGKPAPVSLRVNPDIDIHGHPYIPTGRNQDKFGIEKARVLELLGQLRGDAHRRLVGLHAHIGSQIQEILPYRQLGKVMRDLARAALEMGHELAYIDVGGGLGVKYEHAITPAADSRGEDDLAAEPQELATALLESLAELDLPIFFEPGRALVANTGLLLTRVLYLKETGGKQFVIVDAGMNELIRPSLYSAYHAVVPVQLRDGDRQTVDVVGPICESGDFLARDRELPPVQRGDLLAVLTAGAYGFTLSSNYNARPRPAEVLVSGDAHRVIRSRQGLENLWQ